MRREEVCVNGEDGENGDEGLFGWFVSATIFHVGLTFHSHSSIPEGNGGHGKAGQIGTDGESGCDVKIDVSAENEIYLVSLVTGQSSKQYSFHHNEPISLFISSQGGKGGRGGNGGPGGIGGMGKKGAPANQFCPGGDGTPGGKGGDGGHGGDGGRGGSGGNITIRLSEEDMDSLMLFDPYPCTKGGKGGKGGLGGMAGMGGRGGPGGPAFTYTPSTPQSAYSSETTVCSYESCTMPAGKEGPRGDPGAKGLDGERGISGREGTVEIIIQGSERTDSYDKPYSLRLDDVKIVSPNESNIIEPGSRLQLYLTYSNTGSCPTPKYQDIISYVESTEWITCNKDNGVPLPRNATGSFQLVSPLSVRVKDIEHPSKEDPFFAEGKFDHRAFVSRVNREFHDLIPTNSTFGIRYPVEMEPIQYNNTVDMESVVQVSIRNISSQALGKNSPQQRLLRLRVLEANEETGLSRDKFDLIKDNAITTNDLIFEIENLEDESACHLSFSVRRNEKTEPNSFAEITLSLELGNINQPSSYKAIQERRIRVQFSESYRPASSSVTLVVNNRTENREINQWKTLISKLRDSLPSVYNISLYNGLDMHEKRVSDGKSMIDDLAGDGLLIFLNNICSRCVDNQAEFAPFEVLCNINPIELVRKYDIRVYIVGQAKELTSFLGPLMAHERSELEFHYDSCDAFLHTGLEPFAHRLRYEKQLKRIFYSSSENLTNETTNRQDVLVSSRESGISPSAKAASIGADLASYLEKQRHTDDKLYKISRWQKRFMVLRRSEETLSWYGSTTDKTPRGVLDLSLPITLDIIDPEEHSKHVEYAFTVSNDTRSLTLMTLQNDLFVKWVSALDEFTLRHHVQEATVSPNHVVDDVFYGWVSKKAPLGNLQRRFMVLRVFSMTISFYRDRELATPCCVLSGHVARVLPYWKENDSTEETSKFSIVTPLKSYYFKADIPNQPTAQEWLERISNLQHSCQQIKHTLSLECHLSSMPERRGVIPIFENVMAWNQSKESILKDHAIQFVKNVESMFPTEAFGVTYHFAKENKHASVNSGLVISTIPENQIHSSDFIQGQENTFHLFKCLPFIDRLEIIRDKVVLWNDGQLNKCLIMSIVSDLADEIDILRQDTVSLSEHFLRNNFALLHLFVQYDWFAKDLNEVTEDILMVIVVEIRAILKDCSGVSDLWTNTGVMIKIVTSRLDFFMNRWYEAVGRSHAQELETMRKNSAEKVLRRPLETKQHPFISQQESLHTRIIM